MNTIPVSDKLSFHICAWKQTEQIINRLVDEANSIDPMEGVEKKIAAEIRRYQNYWEMESEDIIELIMQDKNIAACKNKVLELLLSKLHEPNVTEKKRLKRRKITIVDHIIKLLEE